MHSRTLVRLVSCALAGALGPAAGAFAGPDLDAARNRHLPFRAEVESVSEVAVSYERGWCRPYVVARLDGIDAVFSARNPGIVRIDEGPDHYDVVWQHNLPPAYCHRTPVASLEGLWDVDGDGRPELVLISPTADGKQWLLQALAAGDGAVVGETVLAGGPDRRADGRWDGVYAVVGVDDVPAGGGVRRAYIVAAETGLDWSPRGVMAVDVRSGDVLWTHWTAVKPSAGRVLRGDLDGDGATETVYLGSAVNNVGRPVGGLADDVCSVVAVGPDGARRWAVTVPEAVAGSLALVPATGGALVAVAATPAKGHPARLWLVDGRNGTLLARTDLPGNPRGVAVRAAERGADLFVAMDGVGIGHYRHGRTLELVATATSRGNLRLHGFASLLPGLPPQLLAGGFGGDVFVLDEGLQPVAYVADPPAPIAAAGMIAMPRYGADPVLVVVGTEHAPGFTVRFAPNPRPIPWSALALLPAAAGAAWYVRRRRRGTSAATRRELRLQLLGRLELSGHGAIGALRSLRRLVWLLDARAQAAATSSGLDARLAGLLDECRDHMLPDLAGTLELAGLAGCGAAVTGQARGAHERLARLLDTAGTDPAVDQELREAAALLEGAMRSLRREVEDDFRTDLAAVAARVLDAHAEAAAAAGVTVATAGLDAPLWCRGDADELVFVLDNLVENALRAMAGSARRELTLRARREDSLILLQVQDTGCGIAPDDWEPVLETRMSTREGGGLGLPESRRRLRKHGGSLAVTASRAGAGTTLTLSVVPARAREGM